MPDVPTQMGQAMPPLSNRVIEMKSGIERCYLQLANVGH